MDAAWNWWGSVNPNVASAPYVPYLSNVPRFVRPLNYVGDNPALPAPSAVQITVNTVQYSGPNSEDQVLNVSSVTTYARATAYNNQWVGYTHPARPEYLSWTLVSGLSSTPNLTGVLDLTPQADNNYANALTITQLPLRKLDPTATYGTVQKGFGLFDSQYTGTYSGSRHPGIDFFGTPTTDVMAATGGIVVGIGTAGSSHPGSWGAIPNQNLVIRTGGYFLLYGHMQTIDPSIYLGARVGPGAVLGTLYTQGPGINTHLHLEVRLFKPEQMTAASGYSQPVYCNYGQIVKNAVLASDGHHPKPYLATDPMRFINWRGSTTPPPSGSNERVYQGALLLVDDEVVSFDYRVGDDLDQKSFNIVKNVAFAVISPNPAPAGPQYCP